MDQQLREFVEFGTFDKGTMRGLTPMLPSDDAGLDALLDETTAGSLQSAFILIVTAALLKGRKIDSRHLIKGGTLLHDPILFAKLSWKMEGNLTENILAAMKRGRLRPDIEAMALFVAARWWKEHRTEPFPPQIIIAGRLLARVKWKEKMDLDKLSTLHALAVITEDPGLISVLDEYLARRDDTFAATKKDLADAYLKEMREPLDAYVPNTPPPQVVEGYTMRRAVARTGRNEPCPCGSGKKYKHCCIEKDQQRLKRSGRIAGQAGEDVWENPEQHLTRDLMDICNPHEIVRFKPEKIAPELLDAYFFRLGFFHLFDAALDGMEKLGYDEDFRDSWEELMAGAVREKRKDIAQRLLKVREPSGFTIERLHVGARLLLAEDDPATLVKLLEEVGTMGLDPRCEEELLGMSHGLLTSRFAALGIFVSRSVIPIVSVTNASELFEQVLLTRDRLNIPPEDPYREILDQRLQTGSEDDEGKDAEALRDAQQRFETKAREVRELKESLHQLQREVELREKRALLDLAPVNASTATDEKAMKDLRDKVDSLKSELKQRHGERNELRRELQEAQSDLETLRQNVKPDLTVELKAKDDEEELCLPEENNSNQPVRLIEFPNKFHERLNGFARHVARGAMSMIGRLAAGEPAAYVGVVRLKACPNISRQRIGSDYRLLFRLLPDRVQVIDLINRKDLERKIKTLM